MPSITTMAVAALAFMVVLGASCYKAYNLGANNVRAEYAARDLQQANEAAAATKAVEEKYRAKEQASAQALAQVSTDYERKLTDAQSKTTLALNAIRSGSVRLRDPYAKPEACSGGLPEAAASSSGPNGPTAGGLSRETSEFLVQLAAEADRNTRQLAATQAALVADRQ